MNINKMMRQVQKMQAEMMRAQEELETQTVEASAGGGAVTVTVTGRLEVTQVKIQPEAVDPDDVEMLEDLITAAVNEGIRQAQKMVSDRMAQVTGGLNIPGLGGLM